MEQVKETPGDRVIIKNGVIPGCTIASTTDTYLKTEYVSTVVSWRDSMIKNNLPPVGRNQPCPCGSGIKFKHCCWPKFVRARAEIMSPLAEALYQKEVAYYKKAYARKTATNGL